MNFHADITEIRPLTSCPVWIISEHVVANFLAIVYFILFSLISTRLVAAVIRAFLYKIEPCYSDYIVNSNRKFLLVF